LDELAKLRNKIDDVDEKIVGLLAERFRLVGEISKVKVKLKIPVVDAEREKQILVRVKKLAQNYKAILFKPSGISEGVWRELLGKIVTSHEKQEMGKNDYANVN